MKKLKVQINSYHPVLVSAKLQILALVMDLTLVNFGTKFYTVTDDSGLIFKSYNEAENYCNNQDYEIIEEL